MSASRYWFNIVTSQVETDAGPGRRRDRMGPYPTAEAAADALRTARARNEVWESPLRNRPRPEGWPAVTAPKPLSRSDRFVLRHRRVVGVVLVGIAVVLAAVAIDLYIHGENGSGLLLVAWYAVWMRITGIPALVRRQQKLEALSDVASGAPRDRTPR
jgi:hypothetical protein